MKKIILLALGVLAIMVSWAFSAGTVTVSSDSITRDKTMRVMKITCVGAINDTNLLPTTAGMSGTLVGWFPWNLIVENESGTTPTANSDVYLRDTGDNDLLDGLGVDQLDNNTRNDIEIHSCDPIVDTPYLDVDNQSGTTAVYTITLIFVK